jgi:ubiquinone/menaquinone biosynthesis C-methylase UbiE
MDNAASTLEGMSDKAHKTAARYVKANAWQYEKKRSGTSKWEGEDRKVKKFLNGFPIGTSILDIPCGTGRFFPYYCEKQFKVLGMDISQDMLAEADKRAAPNIRVEMGNIFDIDTCMIFDVVLCIRFLNLIEADDLKRAMTEMQRVGRRIIFTLRVRQPNPTGHYHSPHSLSLIEEALLPRWKIGRNESAHQEDYRLIEVFK